MSTAEAKQQTIAPDSNITVDRAMEILFALLDEGFEAIERGDVYPFEEVMAELEDF